MESRAAPSTRVLGVGPDTGLLRSAVSTLRDREEVAVELDRVAGGADLAALREQDYDCVVWNGDDTDRAVATLLSSVEGQSVPVLVVTEDPALATDAVEAGAADVFVPGSGVDDASVLGRRLENVLTARGRERQFRAEREFSELALDTLDDVFYLVDAGGDLVRWNETFAVVTGYSDEELAGMNALEFFESGDRERVTAAIERTLETGTARVRADLVRKDGTAIPFEFSGARLSDDDGNLRGVVGVGRDVAGREEREAKLRQIREHVSDVVWMSTPDKSRMEFVSDSYEEVWGRSTESLDADPTSFVDAVHPEDRERVEAALERQRTDPDGYEETYRVVRPDGEVRWVHDRASGVYDGGELTRIVGIASDVTERKERERELEVTNRAMDEAPVGITISDPDREDNPLVYANRQFERVTGYDSAAAVGRNCRFLQGEATDPETVAKLREGIDAREPTTVELRNYRADGTEFWNEVTVAPVTDEDGDLVNYVGFQQDVTDRREREREIELKTRAMDETPIGITIHDAADGTITYANGGLVELTGYEATDLRADWLSVLRGSETDAESVARLERALEREEATSVVVLFYRADGTPFWSRVNLAPVENDRGETTHFVGFQQDVTESKEHEQEIARRLDEFSDVLAEELRAPVQQARRDVESARGRDPDAAVETTVTWLDRLDGLIDDLATVHSFSVNSRETSAATAADPEDAR